MIPVSRYISTKMLVQNGVTKQLVLSIDLPANLSKPKLMNFAILDLTNAIVPNPAFIFLFEIRYNGGIAYPNMSGALLTGVNAVVDDVIIITSGGFSQKQYPIGVSLQKNDRIEVWAIQNYSVPPLDFQLLLRIDDDGAN